MLHTAKLVAITPDAEKFVAYCARVSNPGNQDNHETASRLIGYLLKHRHLSPFEMASMTLEIETTRAISPQILRHRSFSFQEMSLRYAPAGLVRPDIPLPHLRRQDEKNRQSSHDDLDLDLVDYYQDEIQALFDKSSVLYQNMLAQGIAKECAREILPMATPTRLYMAGTLRSWITYVSLREKNGTQLEHQKIALSCKQVFSEQCPAITEALGGPDAPWQL
jgi:thymidylate synthase (FAD)